MKISNTMWSIFIILLLSGGSVFVEWLKEIKDQPVLLMLGWSYLVATLTALTWSLSIGGKEVIYSLFKNSSSRKNTLILIFTSIIGIPSAIVAILSVLEASQATFLDYAMIPIFAFIVSSIAEPASVFNSKMRVLGIVICLVGFILILASKPFIDSNASIWPPGLTSNNSLVFGLLAAVVSAACSALSLQAARTLTQSHLRASLLVLKFAPASLGFFLVAMLWIKPSTSLEVNFPTFISIIMLALLLALPLFLFYGLLKEDTLAKVAPVLFLIPAAVLLLSLVVPGSLRKPADIQFIEEVGMVIIILGYFISERSERFKKSDLIKTG